MTALEAFGISAMEGRAITHRYFTDEENLRVLPDGTFLLEDGVKVEPEEFWEGREGPEWQQDWSIWE